MKLNFFFQERNKLLSDFVSATFDVHQREIFSAIVTQYTDWESSTRHPVGIMEDTMEALQVSKKSEP